VVTIPTAIGTSHYWFIGMAALILTLILTFLLAGGLWFVLGSKLSLADEDRENDLANLLVYFLALLPVSFVLVFFGIGG